MAREQIALANAPPCSRADMPDADIASIDRIELMLDVEGQPVFGECQNRLAGERMRVVFTDAEAWVDDNRWQSSPTGVQHFAFLSDLDCRVERAPLRQWPRFDIALTRQAARHSTNRGCTTGKDDARGSRSTKFVQDPARRFDPARQRLRPPRSKTRVIAGRVKDPWATLERLRQSLHRREIHAHALDGQTIEHIGEPFVPIGGPDLTAFLQQGADDVRPNVPRRSKN